MQEKELRREFTFILGNYILILQYIQYYRFGATHCCIISSNRYILIVCQPQDLLKWSCLQSKVTRWSCTVAIRTLYSVKMDSQTELVSLQFHFSFVDENIGYTCGSCIRSSISNSIFQIYIILFKKISAKNATIHINSNPILHFYLQF